MNHVRIGNFPFSNSNVLQLPVWKKEGENKGSEKEKVSAFDSDGLESKYF